MLIRLVKVNAGAMNSGMMIDNVILFVTTSPPARATNTPTSSVATMAYRGATALATSQAASILPQRKMCPSRLLNAFRPNCNSTPASIAAASECGISFINRANRPVTPHSRISAFANINTPMVSASVTPCRLVASRAAPGVDQAVSTGALYHHDNASVLIPIPSPSAVIHPAICCVLAPAAAAACQIMAAELA